MLRNHQRDVHSKNYNFAGFEENGLRILHCKVSALKAINRVEGEKKVLEEFYL
jgi:hypothetical protein